MFAFFPSNSARASSPCIGYCSLSTIAPALKKLVESADWEQSDVTVMRGKSPSTGCFPAFSTSEKKGLVWFGVLLVVALKGMVVDDVVA